MQCRILRRGTTVLEPIEFNEPIYDVYSGPNCNFRTTTLRLHYVSLTTPRTVLDVDTVTLAREVKHVKDVPNYDAKQYTSVQLFATASDGTRIPMCAVFKTELRNPDKGDASKPFSKGPVLLYGSVLII